MINDHASRIRAQLKQSRQGSLPLLLWPVCMVILMIVMSGLRDGWQYARDIPPALCESQQYNSVKTMKEQS